MKTGAMIVALAASLLTGALAVAQQKPGHTTTWSKPDSLADFEAGEGGKLVWVAEGGNPGGFIKTINTGIILPKPYLRNSLRTVFGTEFGTISFDLKVLDGGSVAGGRLFLSTGNQAFSYDFAARKVLGHDQTSADGWVHHTIPWKADWTDAEAKAQGWVPYGGEKDHWANVVENPIWSDLEIAANVGIDNFCVEAGRAPDAAALKLIDPPPPQDKPLVRYAFDEGSGDLLHDRAGNAPDGKISGAKWVRNGGRWALEFDGVNSFVHCGNINVVGPQTMVAWVWAEPIYSVWQNLTIMGNGGRQISYASRNELHAGGGVGSLPYRKWTHIAMAWDGQKLRLYVDGTLRSTVATREPSAGGDFILAAKHVLQANEPPEYERRFKGRIASLAFYNRPLTHEQVLEDLRTSNITDSPMTLSIAQPGLDRIKVEVDAARLGRPLQNVTVQVEVARADAASGPALLSATAGRFDAVGRAVMDVAAPELPKGQYVVRATAKDGAGKVLGTVGEEPLSWAGSAQFPSGPAGARKLNNLVTELLSMPGSDESGTARPFVNPRAGFIYICNSGARKVTITPAEAGAAMELPLSQDYGEAFETVRYLPRGRYTITTPLAKDLIVRAVAQTMYDYAYTEGSDSVPYGVYAGEFEQRYIFPHYNTFLVHQYNADKPFVAEWQAKGRRMLSTLTGNDVKPKEGQSPVDAAVEFLAQDPGFTSPLYSGTMFDEFAESNPGFLTWSQALERLLSQPQFKGRVFHAWDYALYDMLTYKGGEEGRQFMRTLEKYDCPVQWECYVDSQRTELDAWRHIHDKMVGEVLAADAVHPGVARNVIVVPYAAVTGGPPWLTVTWPGYDVRVFLDMQVRTVATDPAYAGVHGLGLYRSCYIDEETMRWMARLYRHYAIEGHTEPLSAGPFVLSHIRDGDFEVPEQQAWELKPAEEGSIRYGMYGLGSIEGRYTGRNGDTVLITRRSAKAPNVFTQQIKDLQPGRLYSFRMCTADRQDMSKKEQHALSIDFGNADLVPDKCFTYVARGRAQNKWLNWHVRVFRAKDTTAQLTVSDWASPREPGGAAGQELLYNFIKVQPYRPAE